MPYHPIARRAPAGAVLLAAAFTAASAFAAPAPPFVQVSWSRGRVIASELRAGDERSSVPLVLRGVAVPDPVMHDYSASGLNPEALPGLLRELFHANAVRIAVHPGSLRAKSDRASARHSSLSLPSGAPPAAAETMDASGEERIWSFVERVRASAAEQGMYVILDLHAIGHPSGLIHAGGLWAASPGLARSFWSKAAARYKGNPEVIFELFNEPFGSPVLGPLTRLSQAGLKTYYSSLIQTILEAGSKKNLILLSGPEFASELSGFARDPLTQITLGEGPQARNVPLAHRVAYGIHFYPSRPNTGGLAPANAAQAMAEAIPPNLAVVVSEWAFDAGRKQEDMVERLAELGRLTPEAFLDRFAADPSYFRKERLGRLLAGFDLSTPETRAEFSQRMYDGRLLAEIHKSVTPRGLKRGAQGGLAALLKSPEEAGSPSDRSLIETLSGMPFNLELADKPGYREALSRVLPGKGSVAFAFADWGGLVERGKLRAGVSESDLTEYGRFLRQLYDGSRW